MKQEYENQCNTIKLNEQGKKERKTFKETHSPSPKKVTLEGFYKIL